MNAVNGQTVEALLGVLEGVKSAGDRKWQARCPAHDDDKPSLCIADEPDKILLYCQAGCALQDVVAAIGWTMADLFKGERSHNGNRTRFRIVATTDSKASMPDGLPQLLSIVRCERLTVK